MPTVGLYLAIMDSSGSPSVVFADGTGRRTDYFLTRNDWAPAIAGLREDQLGGQGPYAEVVEEWECNILGETPAIAQANLATLARLLEQADRWRKGESVNAVLFKVSPVGATVSSLENPLQATILSRAGSDPAAVSLPVTFNRDLHAFMIAGVRVRFVRQGALLANTEVSASSAATTNGDLATITIAATDDPSPTRIQATNYGVGDGDSAPLNNFEDSFIALVDSVDRLVIVNAEGMAPSTDYTSVVDSATAARNTNVLRYTPTITTERRSAAVSVTVNNAVKLLAVFAALRNNSSTTSFRLRIRVDSAISAYTPELYIPPFVGAALPKWQFVGLVPMTSPPTLSVYAAITASAAAGSLDIDSVVLLDVTDPTHYAFVVGKVGIGASATETTLVHDHQLLSKPTPNLKENTDYLVPYKGDLVFYTSGGTLYLLSMGTGARAISDRWRQCSITTTVLSQTWTAWRRTAFLTPQ